MSVPMTATEAITPSSAGRRSVAQTFERLAEPLRREIKLHCYRMLGSLHEAEDLVQETYLRAWRSFGSFEGADRFAPGSTGSPPTPASMRSPAASTGRACCPTSRRLPPPPCRCPTAPPTEVAWLEPYPDSNLEGIADEAPNPEARYTAREAVQLAFVAAIQQLPPRQRAALMLCDVLGWAAAEAATLLGGTTASINSALQRARETLAKRYPDGAGRRVLPQDAVFAASGEISGPLDLPARADSAQVFVGEAP